MLIFLIKCALLCTLQKTVCLRRERANECNLRSNWYAQVMVNKMTIIVHYFTNKRPPVWKTFDGAQNRQQLTLKNEVQTSKSTIRDSIDLKSGKQQKIDWRSGYSCFAGLAEGSGNNFDFSGYVRVNNDLALHWKQSHIWSERNLNNNSILPQLRVTLLTEKMKFQWVGRVSKNSFSWRKAKNQEWKCFTEVSLLAETITEVGDEQTSQIQNLYVKTKKKWETSDFT